MVYVPCVIKIRFSGHSLHRLAMTSLSASVMRRDSLSIATSTRTGIDTVASLNISPTCVSEKRDMPSASCPVSSIVPPVVINRIGLSVICSEIQVADDFGVDFDEIGLADAAPEADGVAYDEAGEACGRFIFLEHRGFCREIDGVVGAADGYNGAHRERRSRNTLQRSLEIARREHRLILKDLEASRHERIIAVVIRTGSRKYLVARRDVHELDGTGAFGDGNRRGHDNGSRAECGIGKNERERRRINALNFSRDRF